MTRKLVEDWSKYPNFSKNEFKCSCCGKVRMSEDIVGIAQYIRTEINESLTVSSGYRCPNHPIESKKKVPGEHSLGMSIDIKCHGEKALKVLKLAILAGVVRIGINQKGPVSSRFIHIGTGRKENGLNSPWVWSY